MISMQEKVSSCSKLASRSVKIIAFITPAHKKFREYSYAT
jgi:hypothetical protein